MNEAELRRALIEELEKVKAEIQDIEPGYNFEGFYYCQSKVLDVIDKHIENKWREYNYYE